MGEAMVTGGAHAAKAVGYEALDVLVDYLIPLGAGIAGFVAGPALIGGTYSLANTINSGLTSAGTSSGSAGTRIAGFVMGGVFALIGFAFWRLGHREGWIVKVLGKSVGAFFLALALQNVIVGGIGNHPAPQNGALDKLFDWVQTVSKGG